MERQTCGCKGARSCILCQDSERVRLLKFNAGLQLDDFSAFVYCYVCARLCPCSNTIEAQRSLAHLVGETAHTCAHDASCATEEAPSGILVLVDFISDQQESSLVARIDKSAWLPSQSGRRKQDYGPRVNFKRRKVKTDTFVGMPDYADEILDNMRRRSPANLSEYQPFELCNLEYEPSRGSAIDFHQDDTWIWGERLISVNLLSGSVMTLTQAASKRLIYVPMPRRSLLCMSDEVRYAWQHGVLAEHVTHRRIALTMREPALDFRDGGSLYETYGQLLVTLGNRRIPT